MVDDSLHHREGLVTFEGQSACEHFVQRDAECPHVRALIDDLAAYLFGRHVRGCSERRAGASQPRHRVGVVASHGRETKIQYTNVAVRADHDVARLEVTMHNTRGVSARQRKRDLFQNRNRLGNRQRSVLDALT